MGNRIAGLFAPAAIGILLICALYRLLAYFSYVTSFGYTVDPLDYVSDLPFMVGAAAGSLVCYVTLFCFYLVGRLRPWSLDCRGALAVTALAYLFVAVAPESFSQEGLSPVVLGVVWGLAVTPVGFAVVELLACGSSPIVLIVQLAGSSFLLAVVSFLLGEATAPVEPVVCAVAAVALIPLLKAGRTRLAPRQSSVEHKLDEKREGAGPQEEESAASAQDRRPAYPDFYQAQTRSLEKGVPAESIGSQIARFRKTLAHCSTPIMAAAFFGLVTGLVNTFAFFTHSPFFISSHAPLVGSLICSVLVVLFVMTTTRTFYERLVYLGIFPAIIAVFLALPFFSAQLSGSLSIVIYSAHVLTAILAMFCVIEACRKTGDSIYGIMAFSSMVMRLCLAAGLVLGWFFGTMQEGSAFVHISIVCVVCVYVLGMVVVWWSLKNAREKQVVEVVEVRVEHPAETFEQSTVRQVEELVDQFSLSPRERDVLIGLAQGNTAARIAEGLNISTSTVQGYIKSLYVKLGVNKKQQVIDLFQR
ncbi:helix-turn-helix transcriptional regulator [Adlercreutzia sp. ZJ141]|uniref:helix-turn-helix transcriptional regulator n=1 Tax=Adlercreutzia sp. ZJ141 TaxID=2709406 RepID=UPI0013EB2FB4|nr:LuxR C-terminal-related transcriptional regulator [Adlercreutzia sp. ZJ141]